MWGDMSLWNVQGPLLHSGVHIVPRILTVDYTFNVALGSLNRLLQHCITLNRNNVNLLIMHFYPCISEIISKHRAFMI